MRQMFGYKGTSHLQWQEGPQQNLWEMLMQKCCLKQNATSIEKVKQWNKCHEHLPSINTLFYLPQHACHVFVSFTYTTIF